jgi:uncharacterized membrane protein (DUF373 family)
MLSHPKIRSLSLQVFPAHNTGLKKGRRMENVLKKFERVIVLALMAFMILAISICTVEVGIILCRDLLNEPILLLDVQEIMEIFGFILMVVIGLELLETIKAYLSDHVVHVEVVLLVALVAVARKVIILDYKEISSDMLVAIAALVISLSANFFIIRHSLQSPSKEKRKKTD